MMLRCDRKCPAGGNRFVWVHAFSLLEVLVATTVLALLLAITLATFNQTIATLGQASSKASSFQTARTAFDLMSKTMSQATLNTYLDYYDANGVRRSAANATNFIPDSYKRASDLPFVIQQNSNHGQSVVFAGQESRDASGGKQGTQGLLNLCSYAVQFGSDQSFRPSSYTGPVSYRYRLMQAVQPRDGGVKVFSNTGTNWISGVTAKELPVAANVIALIIWPRLSPLEDSDGTRLSTNYQYDSLGGSALQLAQLPPVLQVTMVVIDEASANRLASGGTPPAVIETALSKNNRFHDVTKCDSDLQGLQDDLLTAGIKFELFSTAIPIRESKWSD